MAEDVEVVVYEGAGVVAARRRIDMSNSSSRFDSAPKHFNNCTFVVGILGVGDTCHAPEIKVFENYFFTGGE